MMDGMAVGKTTVIAAMGIASDGHKCMLGLTAGGTENQEAVKALLIAQPGTSVSKSGSQPARRLEETLVVHRLKVSGLLRQTLSNTMRWNRPVR